MFVLVVGMCCQILDSDHLCMYLLASCIFDRIVVLVHFTILYEMLSMYHFTVLSCVLVDNHVVIFK